MHLHLLLQIVDFARADLMPLLRNLRGIVLGVRCIKGTFPKSYRIIQANKRIAFFGFGVLAGDLLLGGGLNIIAVVELTFNCMFDVTRQIGSFGCIKRPAGLVGILGLSRALTNDFLSLFLGSGFAG